MFVRIGIAAKYLGICIKTLHRHEKQGILIPNHRTNGKHRRYSLKQLRKFRGELPKINTAAIYGRVSAHKQKEDLQRQLSFLTSTARDAGFKVIIPYRDIASGVNDKRKGLLRLLKDAFLGKFEAIYISHNDRLARFGTTFLSTTFQLLGIPLLKVGKCQIEKSASSQFVEDILAILTSYSGKLHRLRRNTFEDRSSTTILTAES